jgi:hypothetical protein
MKFTASFKTAELGGMEQIVNLKIMILADNKADNKKV